jgi:hypothetical protein
MAGDGMKLTFGTALTLAMVAIPAYVVWRITQGVENWFATSGAGDVLMWSFVIALVVSAAAIPVGMWGIAARMWVVKLDQTQRLESTGRVLLPTTTRPILAEPVEALVLAKTLDTREIVG